MRPVDEMLSEYTPTRCVGGDFEARVFSKIDRKKRVRQIGIPVAAVLILLLASLFLIVPGGGQDVESTRWANGGPAGREIKEEIPVIEDFFVAAYGERTEYAIEQVSLSEDDGI